MVGIQIVYLYKYLMQKDAHLRATASRGSEPNPAGAPPIGTPQHPARVSPQGVVVPVTQSSSRGESHPPALTEPDVNLSAHPALAGRLGVAARRCQ